MSRARKLKVGCIAVKDDKILSSGWNGTPAGWDNNCEDVIQLEDPELGEMLKTKPEVIHAEMNCLMKLARSTESGEGAAIFITHSPCIECAKGIYQAGIKTVYYTDEYRSDAGINFLEKCGITIERLDEK